MLTRHLTRLTLCAFLLGAVGCDQLAKKTSNPGESREEKARNLGDQYVRGVLGTGNNAKGTVEVAAIQKAVQLYQVEKGANPSSLSALHAEGYLSQAPTAPPGKRFEYSAVDGSVKLVSQ